LFKFSKSLDSNSVHIQQNINEIAEEKKKERREKLLAQPSASRLGCADDQLNGPSPYTPGGVCCGFGATDQLGE
jgi:hypothetical protein